MTARIPMTQTCRSVDIPTGPGRQTLRLTLLLDAAGQPESLILARGFGGADSGDPFLRPSWGEGPISLPASVLPYLRRALDSLEAS